MNNNLENYGLRYYDDKIENLIFGVITLKTLWKDTLWKDDTNDKYGMGSVTVIGKQSRMDWLVKYVHLTLIEDGFLTFWA